MLNTEEFSVTNPQPAPTGPISTGPMDTDDMTPAAIHAVAQEIEATSATGRGPAQDQLQMVEDAVTLGALSTTRP